MNICYADCSNLKALIRLCLIWRTQRIERLPRVHEFEFNLKLSTLGCDNRKMLFAKF